MLSSKIHDFRIVGFLVPVMVFLLLSRPSPQLEKCWLLPRYACHCFTLRIAMMCWSLLWFTDFAAATLGCFLLETFTSLSGSLKTHPQGGDTMSDPAQVLFILCPKYMMSSTIGIYIFIDALL